MELPHTFTSATVVSGVATVMSVDMMSCSRLPVCIAREGIKPITFALIQKKLSHRAMQASGGAQYCAARTGGRVVLEEVVVEVLTDVLVCANRSRTHQPASASALALHVQDSRIVGRTPRIPDRRLQ